MMLTVQGGLPMYVASRGLYNLKPPTVFVPPCIKEDVEKLLDIFRSMSQVELNLDLVALDIGIWLSFPTPPSSPSYCDKVSFFMPRVILLYFRRDI